MSTTLLMKRAIADRLIDDMIADPSHAAVKVFVRGVLPIDSDSAPDDFYPLYEVVVDEVNPEEHFTGEAEDSEYGCTMHITTRFAGNEIGDGMNPIGRKLILPTFDQVEELLTATYTLLRKTIYKDLRGLSVADGEYTETVNLFRIVGPRVFGPGPGERDNSYSNFGEISFAIGTLIR